MARSPSKARRTPSSRPRGILELSGDGYGFVSTAEGDFFIPARKIGGAFDGDLVEVAPSRPHGKSRTNGAEQARRPSARVVRVLDRAHDTIVGRYEVADPFGVVVPSDVRIPYDVFTMRSDNPDIPDGAVVRVRMVEYPSRNTAATGVVEEVLGMEGDPGLDVDAVIARHHLETRFSEEALAAAASAQVDVEGALAAGYADERDRFVFTVDPVDARDFDDALSISAVLSSSGEADAAAFARAQSEPFGEGSPREGGFAFPVGPILGSGETLADFHTTCGSSSSGETSAIWRLGVHIADVAHYVGWGSAVDVDARKRATSVYLVDRVLPMLPEALSNDVCSLVPGQPRRVFTVDIFLDDSFQVLSVDCHLGVIASRARLSYDQAQCLIDAARGNAGWREGACEAANQDVPQGALTVPDNTWQHAFDALSVLDAMAQSRFEQRMAAGGIEFATKEAKVELDADGRPTGVVVRQKSAATSCVEEAMILANECVARRLRDTRTPGIFRTHDAPSADSLSALVPILQEFGYDAHVSLDAFAAGEAHATQAVLDRARGRAEEALISQLVLRAQQRAVYRAECLGHYGLASDAYCHFTSPIRRYPDLVVHRMLRTTFAGRSETYTAECDSLPWLAEHSSKMERVADAVARETQEMKLSEYMAGFAGDQFDGVISGVATFGLFVQLENTAEGLVPVRSLGSEYFSFDPAAHRLTGQDSGVSYRLGQSVRVSVRPPSDQASKLEFRLV